MSLCVFYWLLVCERDAWAAMRDATPPPTPRCASAAAAAAAGGAASCYHTRLPLLPREKERATQRNTRLRERGQHGGATRLPPGQPLSQENVDQNTIRSTTNTSAHRPTRRGSAARFVTLTFLFRVEH